MPDVLEQVRYEVAGPHSRTGRLGFLRPLGVERTHAAALLLIGLALVVWGVIVTAGMSGGSAAFALLYPLCAYYLGRLVRTQAPLEPLLAGSFAFTFLTGYLTLGLIQFAVHTCLCGPLAWQFALILTAAGLSQFALPQSSREQGAPDGLMGVFLTAFALLAATCWARGLLQSVDYEGDEIVFHNWMDFFSHANMIARYTAGVDLWAQGHAELFGLPTAFAHYASYVGPATQVAFSGQSAYSAALAYWTPMGTFLTGLAAYVLVLPWAGRAGGLCASAALLTLPDASYHWPGNGFLGYHWLQQIGAAGMYGTACGGLALTLVLQWHRQKSRRALGLGLGFAAATLCYKAQILVVLVPLLGACLTLWLPSASRGYRPCLFLAFSAACISGGLALNRLYPEAHPFGVNPECFQRYNVWLSKEFRDPYCRDLFRAGGTGLGLTRYYAATIGLCAVATFGVSLVLGAVLLGVVLLRRQVSAADAVPWGAVVIYLTLYATFNDYALVGIHPWELIHRPFVWAYFLLCTWAGARCWQQLAATAWGRRRLRPGVAALLCVPLLLLPLRMGRGVQQGKSICRFDCTNVRVPRGLIDAAHFVARTAAPLDVLQDSQYDEMLIVGAFAERRAYLARPGIWTREKSQRIRDEVAKRKALVEQLEQQTDPLKLRQAIDALGIRWFILRPNDVVLWPASLVGAPAFTSHGFRVYDLAATPAARASLAQGR
jgi:hypothetical protein